MGMQVFGVEVWVDMWMGMGVLGGHVDGWPERGIFRPKVSAHLETNCRLN